MKNTVIKNTYNITICDVSTQSIHAHSHNGKSTKLSSSVSATYSYIIYFTFIYESIF